MSFIDKVIAAVTPPESAEARADARRAAQAVATPGDWLSQVLDQHVAIERAFATVKEGRSAAERQAALKQLAVLLTGHSNAEESVLYPALADEGEKAHAGTGYEEQAMVKIQMALLEKLDPMSQDFIDKLEHIEGAVSHHMYAEEGNWFIDLRERAPAADQARMTARFTEEFQRYVGTVPA
ncbi:MAG: hemerythrin domain-containing protein [Novosphingobium sp.]|jgi:hemerythrin superfamily protein